MGKIWHSALEVRREVGCRSVVSAISDDSHLQELQSAEACCSGGACTFPGDAESPSCLPDFDSALGGDDVLIAARDGAEKHREPTGDLAGH